MGLKIKSFAFLFILTTLILTSCTAPSTINKKTKTTISFSASPAVLNPPKSNVIALSGSLIGRDQKRITGASILLEMKTGANWNALATVRTNNKGVYYFKYRPKETAYYRASFAGNSTYKVVISKSQKVTVK